MSDAHQSQDLLDHGHRIAQLELKVAELYKRLGQGEPSFGDGSGFSESAEVTASEHPRVIELLQSGNQIGAIKLYSEITGLGLAEAKEAVDQLAEIYRPTG